MNKNIFLAKPIDMSTGFKDFFDTIGLTGAGLVTKGIAAVIAVIALGMLLKTANDPKGALRKGAMAVGTLFVAVVLALYGDTLFSTVTQAKG
jgi:type IV secretory pathway VirB2 component (pilin)